MKMHGLTNPKKKLVDYVEFPYSLRNVGHGAQT